MTLVKHELKQGKTSFFIWTAAVGLLLSVCIFLYPEMKERWRISVTFLLPWVPSLPPLGWIG